MRYYRNRIGTVVHYAHCDKVTPNSVPWAWAETKSNALIALHMAEKGIAPCRLCNPPLYPARAHLRLVSGE